MRDTAGTCPSCPETSLYMTSTAATARWQQGGNGAMRRHRHKKIYAFDFAPFIEKDKMLTQKSVRNRQMLRLGQSLRTKWHGQHLKHLRHHRKSSRKSRRALYLDSSNECYASLDVTQNAMRHSRICPKLIVVPWQAPRRRRGGSKVVTGRL